MGLFKKRGKHVRSGKKSEGASEAPDQESYNAEQPDAGGQALTANVIAPLEESSGAASSPDEPSSQKGKPAGGLNKPESLDAPKADESAKDAPAAPVKPLQTDKPDAAVDSNSETQVIEPIDAATDSSSETQVIEPIPEATESVPFKGSEWSDNMDDSVYEAIPAMDAPVFKSTDLGEITAKKKRRGLKAFGIAMGVVVIVACAVYVIGAVVFMGRFLPNTTIGDYDVSLKSDVEVVDMLEGIAASYQIDVVGNGFSYRAAGSDIGLSIDAESIVQAMHEDMNAWTWPMLIVESDHDESDQMSVTIKQSSYEANVTDAVNKFNETATPPTNATIVYDEAASKFIVKKEEVGTQLDPKVVLASFGEAVDALQPKLVLDQSELLQPTVLSTDEKLNASAQLATGMVSAKLSLVMAGKQVGEVDGQSLSQFVTIDENLDVTFKDEEMNAWVDSLAAGFNTVGSARTYQRADGKQITVEGGVYGWEVDTAALKDSILAGIKAGSTTQIEVPCAETAAVYNGAGQRDWGNRYIDVDISEQHVRFYGDDGTIIWETDCISGSPDGSHNTVPGVWVVNAKESPSKLIGYENGKKIYETTVTFWMPFEGNGIGFHDATWQPGFGGSMYANGYGSHGCVNLSYSAAQELYGIIQQGDVVVVHS